MSATTISVLESYLFANTPGYLYRHLRSAPAVAALARNSEGDLIARLNSIAAKAEPTAEDMANGYAMLVALTFKRVDDWETVLADLRTSRLHWAADIVAIHRGKHLPTQVVALGPSVPLVDEPLPQSARTTTISFG